MVDGNEIIIWWVKERINLSRLYINEDILRETVLQMLQGPVYAHSPICQTVVRRRLFAFKNSTMYSILSQQLAISIWFPSSCIAFLSPCAIINPVIPMFNGLHQLVCMA